MAKSRTIQLIIAGKDRVSKTLKRITGSLKKWGVGALKITGGLVAGFGAVTAALGVMFKKLAGQIDEQAKMAAALGIQNEALGAMRDAAGYAGISVENLSTALRKMSQGVGDAANGTGEAKDALEALGLNAANLQKMKPEEAFTAIIAELDKIPNGIKKTTLAMDLFGRSGAAMTNLTAKGLQQAQQDAEDLGLKLSTAQARHVEAANDAWARIKNTARDFLHFITATVAPQIKGALDAAFEFVKKGDVVSWAKSIGAGITSGISAILKALPGIVRGAIKAAEMLVLAFSGFKQIRGLFDIFFKQVQIWSLEFINQLRLIAIRFIEAVPGLTKSQRQEAANPIWNDIGNTIATIDIKGGLSDQLEKAKVDLGRVQNAQEETAAAFDEMAESASSAIKGITDGALKGLIDAQDILGSSTSESSKEQVVAIDSVTSALQRRIEKEQQLNAERGKSGGTFSVASFSNALDDEADR